MDIYVLNGDFERVGLVDAYKSLIWTNRYIENGDCELYVPATAGNIALLKKHYYLCRDDDDMVCEIVKIELDTSAENGDFLIVTGLDVKAWVDQRVIWAITTTNGAEVEDVIRFIVTRAMISPVNPDRAFKDANGNVFLSLDTEAGFTERITEQFAFLNLGEKIREYCDKYNWGFKIYKSGNGFKFKLYKGTDRSGSVIFSSAFDNLGETTYIEDETKIGNSALIVGEGKGSERLRESAGGGISTERYEKFIDAKDLSRTITWAELTENYPTTSQGGYGYITGTAEGGYRYKMSQLDIQIIDDAQLSRLQTKYPSGTVVTVGGVRYFRITNIIIADLPNNAPDDNDNVTLHDVIYSSFLISRGYDELAEFGGVQTFEGKIFPYTFTYKQDYYLGDVVKIENDYGISANARIIEVIESDDDTGYSVQPTFLYKEV